MSYSISTRMTWAATVDDLAETFRKWRIREWTLTPTRPLSRSMYQNVEERRVTLRYSPNGGPEVVLTMEKQNRAVDNLRVLYLAVEAVRMNEARGIGDVVREAYLQLPAPATQRDPFEVLGVRSDAEDAVIQAAYLSLSKSRHPDAGGTTEAMQELNEALERITQEREG